MTDSPADSLSINIDLSPAIGEPEPIPASSDGTTPSCPTLDTFFEELATEREPASAGGVPIPGEWRLMQAVLGGASRKDLEQVDEQGVAARGYGAYEHLAEARRSGTHLPAGLHIFTGQTGGGKSALVTNLSHAALGAGHPVLYVSLELDGVELAARLLALEAKDIAWMRLALRRKLRDEERSERDAAMTRYVERAKRLAVLAPDGPFRPGHLTQLRDEALRLWRLHGKPPLVVFDYLQAASIATTEGSGRALQVREHVAAVTMTLRRLSRTIPDERNEAGEVWHGCPVAVLSITARGNVRGETGVRGMDGKSPDALRFEDIETLKALPKEAGEVEATAVTAWVLALGETDEQHVAPLTIRLAKNRLGPKGQWIPFSFDVRSGRLQEAPARYSAPCDGGTDSEPGNGTKRRTKRGVGAAAAESILGADGRGVID